MAPIDYNGMIAAYIEGALWTTDEESEGYPRALAHDAYKVASDTIFSFVDAHKPLVLRALEREGYTAALFGHDLWLTRNGHGAGFWDRDELVEGDLGDALTLAAEMLGEASYESYDGVLYIRS